MQIHTRDMERALYDHQRARAALEWIRLHCPEGAHVLVVYRWGSVQYRVTQKGISLSLNDDGELSHQVLFDTKTTPALTQWSPLFRSTFGEVWERRFAAAPSFSPRHGLTLQEKQELFTNVRSLLEATLENERPPTNPFTDSRFQIPYGVDVALWVDGEVRGSIVRIEGSLGENLFFAACGALTDDRFKPVSQTEIARARIEITLISDLHLPIASREIHTDHPETNIGYLVKVGRHVRGWYLPQVFNSVSFSSFSEFAKSLLMKKAKLSGRELSRARLYACATENFIENTGTPLALAGTLPNPKAVTEVGIQNMCSGAAQWITALITNEGYIAPVLHTDHYSERQFDATRTAFTAMALAEYGELHDGAHRETCERLVTYTQKVLAIRTNNENNFFAKTYLAQYYALTNRESLASALLTEIDAAVKSRRESIEPIFAAQIARTHQLLKTGKDAATTELIVTRFFSEIQASAPVSLASYAELLTLTRHTPEINQKIVAQYLSYQLPSGAFPNMSTGGFSYVRGTGKILEALAALPDTKESVERGFTWAARYQYTEATLYHIPPHMRTKLMGGFRHDDLNREAWIDGAAHIIIAGARYLKRHKKTEV